MVLCKTFSFDELSCIDYCALQKYLRIVFVVNLFLSVFNTNTTRWFFFLLISGQLLFQSTPSYFVYHYV